MRHAHRRTGRPGPVSLLAALLAVVLAPGALSAESVETALNRTMKSMAAALSQIEKFTKAAGEQPAPVDSARRVVGFAKSIPGIFPPGSELQELPVKFDAPPTSWSDFERFLDGQKRLVVETSKLFAVVRTGDKAAIARQVAATRQVCTACHGKFRN
jgi:cytochrome c556